MWGGNLVKTKEDYIMVNITFTCDGQTLTETNALDFGTVQAGLSSPIKTITVTNTGDSDALDFMVEAVESTIANGFAADTWVGTAQETYMARKFAATVDGPWYDRAVVGVGKNYATMKGGTLANTSGTDTFATKSLPPSNSTSGLKVHGDRGTCVYV
jgi:hypothetical protein